MSALHKELKLEISMAKEFGDFQTNPQFTEKVCKLLVNVGVNPEYVVEPTCGRGNFIVASIKNFSRVKKIVGIELQDHYVREAKNNLKGIEKLFKYSSDVNIIKDDIFIHKFDEYLFDKNKELLLIGNPPWVTNSELKGKNLPKKSNFKKNNGLDAITGKSNFDISEYILLHLLNIFKDLNGHFAFLCKTQVAKNMMHFLQATDFTASDFKIYLFNAKKEFDVIVDACLFVCTLSGREEGQEPQCKVYNIENPEKEIKKFGWFEGKFVSNIEKYKRTKEFEGKSQIMWRSGIKHDCSKVMELDVYNDIGLKNGHNEILSIEGDLVYPLLKSSNIKGLLVNNSKKKIIVTQKKTGEETKYISEKFPNVWKYLNSHKEDFEKRKSIIYKNNPDFSIFGVGDYSFKRYKLAVSGLYKNPNFSLVLPEKNKTIMVDDSCYFIGFDNINYALILLATLNSQKVKDYLDSIAFIDAKRPYTKEVLMRIDLLKVMRSIGYEDIIEYLKSNKLNFEEVKRADFLSLEQQLIKQDTANSIQE